MSENGKIVSAEQKPPLINPQDMLGLIGLALLVLVGFGAIMYLNWTSWGKPVFFGGVIVVALVTGWKVYVAVHGHALHHIDKREDHKTKRHYRDMTTQALAMGHSVKLEHIDTNGNTWKMETTSPLTIPNAPITVKELNFGQEQALLPAPALPGPTDLSNLLEKWQPDGRSILLGIAPGEQLITVPKKSLCHVALAGATGGGKSTLMRLLFVQLLLSGCQVMLADPHYAPVDPESGEDWRPIASRLSLEPAVSYTAIEDMLNWLAYEELQKRLTLRHEGQPVGETIFLGIDELPAIVDNVKNANQAMGKLLREGRKVNILLVSAAQDWLVKTIGGTGAVRDCFRTAFYVGGDTTSARVLLDVTGRVDDGGLGKGVVMLRSVATPQAALTRIPSVSNEALYRLLSTSNATSEPLQTHYKPASNDEIIEVAGSVAIPALDARSLRIREMLLARSKPKQIIEEIWHTSGGSSYIKASNELTEITATLLERGEI